jgi:glyoxylase-like metal-dependent hydrolase (beta-lactamase superfamily II)
MLKLGFLIGLLAAPALASDADTLSERSQQRARAVLGRAIAATGGEEALREIDTIVVHSDGVVRPRLQTPTVAPPYEAASQSEAVALSLDGSWFRFEQRYLGYGLRNDYAIALEGEESLVYDHVARTVAPFPEGDAEDRRMRAQRRLPQLLLLQALDNPAALRHLGTETFEGRPHEVISLVSAGQPLALYMDSASGLISKYEFLFSDPLATDQAAEILFSDYAAHGKLMIPRAQTTRQAGQTIAEWRLRTEVNPPSAKDALAAKVAAYETVAAPDTSPSTEQLGEGAYLLRNTASGDYHTLVVEFADHVAVVDAPVSPAGSDKVIARVKELSPGKPIRFVALTHHHADHVGGLRSFLAEGATVISMPDNRAVVESVAAARPAGSPAKENARTPQFLAVENGRHVLQDASQRLELIDVGPLPHAREILIAYLPAQRVVYQADIFLGSPTTFSRLLATEAAAAQFARKLRDLGLQVDTIVGGHGGAVAWEQLAQL